MVSFIFDPSLVLYLPLYDLDGGSFASKDAYGHRCTVAGALWRPNGHCFDGVDDYMEVAHHASQLLTTGGTIEAWIKPNGWGEDNLGSIIDKSAPPAYQGGDGFTFRLGGGSELVAVQINAGTQRTSNASSISLGNWHHVVATWDNTGYVTIYVNGSQSGTPGISADPSGIITTNALAIGNRSGGTDRTFDGLIGEMRIYNRTLTSQEIQHNYLTTKWRYR
jgi:hypothetical protein